MNDTQTLIDLQTRVTYMDDTVEQLNDVVSRQQLQIDRLERLLAKLAEEHLDLKHQVAPETIDTKPPHY